MYALILIAFLSIAALSLEAEMATGYWRNRKIKDAGNIMASCYISQRSGRVVDRLTVRSTACGGLLRYAMVASKGLTALYFGRQLAENKKARLVAGD